MAFQLAQLNIALPREPLDSRLLREFVAALDPVNEAADAAPGFVWRLQTESGNATAIKAFGDQRLIVNMSIWESLEALRAFVFSSRAHLDVLRRRREWFGRLGQAHMVLWWIKAGLTPTIAEAEERLEALRTLGPSPAAFTFREHFPAPGADLAPDADHPPGADLAPDADHPPGADLAPDAGHPPGATYDHRQLCPAG